MRPDPSIPRCATRPLGTSALQNVPRSDYRAVAIGASAGGYDALTAILSRLPADYGLPVVVAQHLHPDDAGGFAEGLARACPQNVVTACDKQPLCPAHVYVAPANYHLLVERDGHVALSTEERVNWSRPSIDVLFESAARAFGEGLVAILLTGANDDGTEGLRRVRDAGGLTIAQDPATAESPTMPQAAIDAGVVDDVLGLEQIAERLTQCPLHAATDPESRQ